MTEGLVNVTTLVTHPAFALADISGMVPYQAKEVMVDTLVKNHFESDSIIPFRVETFNIGYDDGGLKLNSVREYLSYLGEGCPEMADKIKSQLIFKDEL